ncbi:glycosyltransferase family 4 protein [Oceanicella actignis]|uniref:Glycosyltransferase involved in cell wall bisynthesis n=1 Tax=Oceanicella actignis TaxID=1189325 RepID=A0A1M7TNE2_9RHOB|nr:glycosyltransferase family 4 protein [Oceanicella actignis]SET72585.1 Glycosyltransferase involved in cell wall bisynthesis [Oceanicella actignis]SHN72269.1 Glycosyltransferase involved in cell wall bisynthesis [Oceanicella actignis]
MSARPRIAFYAPLKPPDHPDPSGDRRIARLTMKALERAGFAPFLASDLRTLDMAGDARVQAALADEAALEIERLLEDLAPAPPALWFTYHCYYKAPDLIGPHVARALGIPYAVSEASHAPSRRAGAWSRFARESERAIRAADVVFWTTRRDLPGLERLEGRRGRLAHLPAFTELPADADPNPDAAPARPVPTGPLRLLTVAMMRPGDKLASYRLLARALSWIEDRDWRLTVVGDGPLRAEVEAMFAPYGARVAFAGVVRERARLRRIYRAHELFLWPGVGEGVGMAYLEAQAEGLPCLAERRPGPADVVHAAPLPEPGPNGDPGPFGRALRALTSDRAALARMGRQAQAEVGRRHSLDAAAALLRGALAPLAAGRAGEGGAGGAEGGPCP